MNRNGRRSPAEGYPGHERFWSDHPRHEARGGGRRRPASPTGHFMGSLVLRTISACRACSFGIFWSATALFSRTRSSGKSSNVTPAFMRVESHNTTRREIARCGHNTRAGSSWAVSTQDDLALVFPPNEIKMILVHVAIAYRGTIKRCDKVCQFPDNFIIVTSQ